MRKNWLKMVNLEGMILVGAGRVKNTKNAIIQINMTEIHEFSFYRTLYSNGCPACNRVEPQGPALDLVYTNNYFTVHQDYVLPIPGMMVIELKRHVKRFCDLTVEEQEVFGKVVAKIETAITEATGIEVVDLHLEEKSSHFHAYLLPIYDWMKELGKTRNLQPIFDYAKNNLTNPEGIKAVEEVTAKIKNFLPVQLT